MPESAYRWEQSVSAADLRPGPLGPRPRHRRPAAGPTWCNCTQACATTAREHRRTPSVPSTAASGSGIGAARTRSGGRPAHNTRPGRRLNAPRAGPPPAGIVAAGLAGPPHPAIAAWRKHGPTHGPPCNRPRMSRHRAHRRAHGHIHREHAPLTANCRPQPEHRVPPAAIHRIPTRCSSWALSAPLVRSSKGLVSRHPEPDP